MNKLIILTIACILTISGSLQAIVVSSSMEVFPIGKDTYQAIIYSQPRFVQLGGQWFNFTDANTADSNNSGLHFRIREREQEAICGITFPFPNSIVRNKKGSWKIDIPLVLPGTNGRKVSRIFVLNVPREAQMDSSYSFSVCEKYISFRDFNYNKSDGSFNSTVSITKLNGSAMMFNLTYSNTRLQEIVFDPSFTQTPESDLELSIVGIPTRYNLYTKFDLAGIPQGSNITTAEINYFKSYNGTNFTSFAVRAYNFTGVWNDSTTANTLADFSKNDTGNSSLVTSLNAFYDWNVTDAMQYAFRTGNDASFALAHTLITGTECSVGACATGNTDQIKIGNASILPTNNNTAIFNGVEIGDTPESPSMVLFYVSPINISFVPPTPSNGSIMHPITNNSVYINVSSNFAGLAHSVYNDWQRTLKTYLSFDYINTTTVFDNSSYNSNATWVGTGSPNITTGNRGYGIKFNGSGALQDAQYVFANGQYNTTNNLTFTMWLRRDCLICLAETLVMKGYNNNNAFGVVHASNTRVTFSFYNGTNYFNVTSSLAVQGASVWNHIAYRWNGVNAEIWVNGVNRSLYAGSADWGGTDTTNTLYVGGRQGAFLSYSGFVDEFSIYNRYLTPAEINATYLANTYQYSNNFTSLAIGNYTDQACAMSVEGNYNCTELRSFEIRNQAPQFIWYSANRSNGTAYTFPNSIQFFSNWTDDNGTVSVIMNLDGFLHSMALWNGTSLSGVWNFNTTSLAAGNHNISFTASDGMTSNASQTFTYVVATGTHALNLTLNNVQANFLGQLGDPVNATSQKPQVEPEGTISLFKNNTLVNSGTFFATDTMVLTDYSTTNYTACVAATQNYSSICLTLLAYVPFPTPTPSPSTLNIVITKFQRIICITNFCLVKMDDGSFVIMDVNSPKVEGDKIKSISIDRT